MKLCNQTLKIFAALFFAVAYFCSLSTALAGHLEDIAARGTIRIGTTGDYIPMSYLNPKTGEYEGI